MSFKYALQRRNSDNSDAYSDYSDDSEYSDSTAPTDYSGRPSVKGHATDPARYINHNHIENVEPLWSDNRQSTCTYASTTPSEADFDEEYPEYTIYEEPAEVDRQQTTAVPSTPPEFAEYFPSTRRLCIRHDDSVDGNMNLRVDTETHRSGGERVDLTLFHLRMHDLKNRQFSLRRHCRDSGREVCHSSRRYTKPPAPARRPGFQRSMSNALASLRSKSDSKTMSKSSLKRTDSGYESMSDGEDSGESAAGSRPGPASNLPMPTKTINLEYSNYAHIDVKRRGAKSSKRYEFEYWGTLYAWRKVSKKDGGDSKEISYHLYNLQSGSVVAHIVPVPLTPDESQEEAAKGGWVPPCSMWISDASILSGLTDVADVIVSTGLIALVDDSIKNRWHRKDRFQFPVPLMFASKKLNMEFVGPKRLLDEVFHRSSNGSGNGARHSPRRELTT